jgi:small conductance mechanosensitive channel
MEKLQTWIPFLVLSVLGFVILFTFSQFLNKKFKYTHKWIAYLINLILLASYVALLIVSTPINVETQKILLQGIGVILSFPLVTASMNPVKNIIGGFVYHLNPSFKPGDIVKIGEVEGWVIEVGVMKIKLKDKYNRIISIPNKNLSDSVCKVVASDKTIIYSKLSLGYDVNINVIKKSLKKAAENIELISPAVWVEELNDYSITYTLRAYLTDLSKYYSAQSNLKEECIKELHNSNVEIMSPMHISLRNIEKDEKVLHKINQSLDSGVEAQEMETKKEVTNKENLHKVKEKVKKEVKKLDDIKKELKEKRSVSDIDKIISKIESSLQAMSTAQKDNKPLSEEEYQEKKKEYKDKILKYRKELSSVKDLENKILKQEEMIKKMEEIVKMMEEGERNE